MRKKWGLREGVLLRKTHLGEEEYGNEKYVPVLTSQCGDRVELFEQGKDKLVHVPSAQHHLAPSPRALKESVEEAHTQGLLPHGHEGGKE